MNKGFRLQGWLRRPSTWLIAGGLMLTVSFGYAVFSQHTWHHRASLLERENVDLQLRQLSEQITTQSNDLAEFARQLADSEIASKLLLEGAELPERPEFSELSRRGVDQ